MSAKTLSQQYQQKTDKQHILDNPDTYIGSIESNEYAQWVYNSKTEKMEFKTINFNPGFYKICDEVLVNCLDCLRKYKNVKHKAVNVVIMNPELPDIILDWMEINQSDYLLSSYFKSKNKYNVFTEGTLCRRLSLIFKKYTTVPVTINTLRHSLISYNSKKEMEYFSQKIDVANKMMHAPSVADTYRRMIY